MADEYAGICLDADRLNLQRLRIRPRLNLLSTAAAAGLVDWTRERLDAFLPWPQLATDAGYPAQVAEVA